MPSFKLPVHSPHPKLQSCPRPGLHVSLCGMVTAACNGIRIAAGMQHGERQPEVCAHLLVGDLESQAVRGDARGKAEGPPEPGEAFQAAVLWQRPRDDVHVAAEAPGEHGQQAEALVEEVMLVRGKHPHEVALHSVNRYLSGICERKHSELQNG